jgi:hypothetical protein
MRRMSWKCFFYAIGAFFVNLYAINVQPHSGSKVGATLVFLSVRYPVVKSSLSM